MWLQCRICCIMHFTVRVLRVPCVTCMMCVPPWGYDSAIAVAIGTGRHDAGVSCKLQLVVEYSNSLLLSAGSAGCQ
jgi:hypothetical protein